VGSSSSALTRPAGPLLEVVGLSKAFGPLRVLQGVNLQVAAGETVALVGENGAGKSTIVRCIAGDLQPDAGRILLGGRVLSGHPAEAQEQGLAVVWQDLALCDNLDVVANLFLGRERSRVLLSDAEMDSATHRLLSRFHLDIRSVRQPVRSLSGGERQVVALARALQQEPDLLILDEPTAALGATQARSVERIIRELAACGTAILLISHTVEHAFALADRIVVLRRGQVAAELAPSEVHPDDVVALMSGVEVDTTARKQLRRLHSLAEQLSEVAPSASLPLIVSAMSAALGQDSVCVHLRDEATGHTPAPMLRRSAAVGLPQPLLDCNQILEVGPSGGSVGLAAATGNVVVVEDVRIHPAWERFRAAALASGILSSWAAPIVSSDGVLGTVSGYGTAVGRLQQDQLELVSLYASYAAAAIERDRALAEATRRNRTLEALRGMLEKLAGPERIRGGLDAALLALCRGLGARAVALYETPSGALVQRAYVDLRPGTVHAARAAGEMRAAADTVRRAARFASTSLRSRAIGDHLVVAPLLLPGGQGYLVAHWAAPAQPSADAAGLLEDAARSLRLAIEREALDAARQEADALRRSHALQRDLLQRLSHELRTPLTAVHGFASTLLQPDVSWDEVSQQRFLAAIAAESERMRRLVGDLLDSSAIESGVLRLAPDWCDLALVLEAAIALMPAGAVVDLDCEPGLPSIWADHDRLEQVFVNLLENALRHSPATLPVRVTAAVHAEAGRVTVRVIDLGSGVAPEVAARIFEPYVRGAVGGAGLGLSIARGIVLAHGGTIDLETTDAGASFRVTLPIEAAGTEEIDVTGGSDGLATLTWGMRDHA
jgi:signal transduction histidine kinase/ABC-type multidrug transport system ATPase subunit